MSTMTISSLSARFSIPASVIFERVHNEGIILDTASEIYFGLNESGTLVWEALASGKTIEEAAQGLVERFSLRPEHACLDATSLAQALLDQRLITGITP